MAKQCSQNNDQNYVVGRGRLFFDKFKDGCNVSETGELYFGNTPELSLSSDTETLDHYSSDHGLREKDLTVMLEHSRSGSFVTDNISKDNLALFFLGDRTNITQTQVTGAKEIFENATRGRFLQLGASDEIPMGVRNVENLKVFVADSDVSVNLGEGDIEASESIVSVPLFGNIDYDLALGRLYIEPTSEAIKDGQQLIVQYDVKAQKREVVIARNRMIYGSLRFISDNPVGENKSYFWPKVMLQPDGDYALKGDDWQQIGFTFSVLRLNRKVEQVYIEVANTAAEGGEDPKPQPENKKLAITVSGSSIASGEKVTLTATATIDGTAAKDVPVKWSIVGAGVNVDFDDGKDSDKTGVNGKAEKAASLTNTTDEEVSVKVKCSADGYTTTPAEVTVTVAPK